MSDLDLEIRSIAELIELLNDKIFDLANAYLESAQGIIDARTRLNEANRLIADPELVRYAERLVGAAECAAVMMPAVVKDPGLKGAL